MNNFLQKHKNLGCLLDWIVFLTVSIIIFAIIGDIKDISTSPKFPLFLNLFVFSMFFYVNLRENDYKKKFNTLKDWSTPIFYVNIIALVLHTAIGGYTKTHKKVLEPLYKINKENAIKIIAIYLIFIIVSGTCILISKKYKK
ncbi:hypothetical protein [Miniphocaeibacter massiliensis]|uniref:hypothetical protein n=1 Tax=Miniphocaeibacter massiliensis TaxID=2041841 RepID=UPI000C07FCAF|nr:hypothetical protein [Miniphocaeibacter massiliensis]